MVLLLAASCTAASTVSAAPTLANGPLTRLVGEWTGRSLCVTTTRPACTDETVVYAIRLDAAKPGALVITADKIVRGQRESMAELACRFEATRQQLVCPMGKAHWRFRWDGTMLVGGLFDPDEGEVRFVHVVKP